MLEISIAAIVPLYNGAPFIREAVESILAQSQLPQEIIVVDDGSTDDGPAIVEELAAKHPITFLRKPNGGQSSARNMAVQHTRCTHVAFLDQDDVWYEDHLAILKQPYIESGVRNLALVYGNLDHIDRAGHMLMHNCLDAVPTGHPKTSLLQCLQHDMFILPSASLVSRDAIIEAGLFDERLSGYEDDDLFVRLFHLGYQSVYLNTAITKWRLYSGSTSFSSRMARSRMIYFQKQLELFPDDKRLRLYWSRDVIGPRFLKIVRNEFFEASKDRDIPRLERAWSDLQEIFPVMRTRTRRRLRRVAPLINLLYRGRLTDVSRFLLRHATK